MSKLMGGGTFVGGYEPINFQNATIIFPCGEHGTQIAKRTFKDGKMTWVCPKCYPPKPKKRKG